jgi:acyl-CoA thioester hydrolase
MIDCATVDMLVKLNIGFVITNTSMQLKREILMNEIICVDYQIDYFSDDYKKYGATHQVFKENGKLACLIKIEGFWIDLQSRRIATPPDELIKLIKETDTSNSVFRL